MAQWHWFQWKRLRALWRCPDVSILARAFRGELVERGPADAAGAALTQPPRLRYAPYAAAFGHSRKLAACFLLTRLSTTTHRRPPDPAP